MARTKIKRRTFNRGTSQRSENREMENLLIEEQRDECPAAQARAPDLATLTETSRQEKLTACENLTKTMHQEEPSVHIDATVSVGDNADSLELNLTTTTHQEEPSVHIDATVSVGDNADRNNDSLELDQPMLPTSYVRSVEDSLTIYRDSPLNLAWDSMKENYEQQPNGADFRPMTPDNLLVPVEEIFSPTTQKEIRASIRNLFPNGPPPPPPVRPMRRPKKGDEPYIVNCSKRPRVPSPKSLRVFTGDTYGITNSSNCDADEPEEECTPGKRANRGTYGSTSKSAFNRATSEITERLKLYEKIDRLVGRTPNDPVGQTTKRSFSPLPSTSTDNETIMKNDKHFSESFDSEFELDEDEELPEVILDSKKYKKEKDRNDLSSPLVSKNMKKENYDYTNSILAETNEEMNNNNDEVIAIEDFREIDIDKIIPREKLFCDMEPKQESEDAVHKKIKINDYFPPQPRSQSFVPSRVGFSRESSSTDVICVDDISTDVLDPIPSAHSVNSPVLRASNKNTTATETGQSDHVIEVTDVLEPINMSRHVPIRPAWDEEVQFVSEEIIEVPCSTSIQSITDGRVVSQPSNVTQFHRTPQLMNQLQQILACFTEQYSRRKPKKKKRNLCSNICAQVFPCNPTASVNDENAAPIRIDNTAPSVNQVASDSIIPSATSPQSKRFGECPICLDNLQTDSIASTNCGHVFCLECIKQSLRTSGKRCPTCRKQLKGVGYHQVYLSF